MVRCGACRQEFDVSGDGRFPCPHCGAINQVGDSPPPMPGPPTAPGAGDPSGAKKLEGIGSSPPVAPPEPIEVKRVICGKCQFQFVVGDIALAICPNCGAEVDVKRARAADE